MDENTAGFLFLRALQNGLYFEQYYILDHEKPNRGVLEEAWRRVLQKYPVFRHTIVIKNGSCFYEPYESECAVKDTDDIRPGEYHVPGKDMISVAVKDQAIIVRFSHCFTDGYGVCVFSKELLYQYFCMIDEKTYDYAEVFRGGKSPELTLDWDVMKYVEQLTEKEKTDCEDKIQKQDPFKTPCCQLPEKETAGQEMTIFGFSVDAAAFGKMEAQLLGEIGHEENKSLLPIGGRKTVAAYYLMARAIQQVHSENALPICGRCPSNVRSLLDAWTALRNASQPQVMLSLNPKQLSKENEQKNSMELVKSVVLQTQKKNMIHILEIVRKFSLKSIQNEEMPKPGSGAAAPTFLVSNLGIAGFVPEENRIRGYAFCSNPPYPMMLYIARLGKRLHFTLEQSFPDEVYVRAFAEQLNRYGIETDDISIRLFI